MWLHVCRKGGTWGEVPCHGDTGHKLSCPLHSLLHATGATCSPDWLVGRRQACEKSAWPSPSQNGDKCLVALLCLTFVGNSCGAEPAGPGHARVNGGIGCSLPNSGAGPGPGHAGLPGTPGAGAAVTTRLFQGWQRSACPSTVVSAAPNWRPRLCQSQEQLSLCLFAQGLLRHSRCSGEGAQGGQRRAHPM